MMKKNRHFLKAVLVLVLLQSCATISDKRAANNEKLKQVLRDSLVSQGETITEVPQDITNALLPKVGFDRDDAMTIENRFDFAAEGANAKDFFMGLVEGTEYNMVVSPGVTGSISLNLKSVTVPEVMQVTRDVYGYEFKQSNNIIQVFPAQMRTAIFSVNYLNLKRSGLSRTSVSSGGISQGSNNNNRSSSSGTQGTGSNSKNQNQALTTGTMINTESKSDFWLELKNTIELIVGTNEGDRKVIVSPQSNTVVVRALPKDIRAVANYLDVAQMTLQREVILEAKILEVTLGDGYQAGIDWTSLSDATGDLLRFSQNGSVVQSGLGVDANRGTFGILFENDDFSTAIDLLSKQGDVHVLSTPRVSTVNNEKAILKVGQDEFFVTDISTTTVTGNSTTSTPNVSLTPFFSGIALDVTPQISAEGRITLHVHPYVSEVIDQIKDISVGGLDLQIPLALSSIRESDSIISSRSGQVIVLGGLMQESITEDVAATPLLSDIPLLGNAFKQVREKKSKTELVILLRATIVGEDTWSKEVQRSLDNLDNMNLQTLPRFKVN